MASQSLQLELTINAALSTEFKTAWQKLCHSHPSKTACPPGTCWSNSWPKFLLQRWTTSWKTTTRWNESVPWAVLTLRSLLRHHRTLTQTSMPSSSYSYHRWRREVWTKTEKAWKWCTKWQATIRLRLLGCLDESFIWQFWDTSLQ